MRSYISPGSCCKLSQGSHFFHKAARWLISLKGREDLSPPVQLYPDFSKAKETSRQFQTIPQAATLSCKFTDPGRASLSRKLGALILAPSSSLLGCGNQLRTNSLQWTVDSHRWEVWHASCRPHPSPCPKAALLNIGRRIRMGIGVGRQEREV